MKKSPEVRKGGRVGGMPQVNSVVWTLLKAFFVCWFFRDFGGLTIRRLSQFLKRERIGYDGLGFGDDFRRSIVISASERDFGKALAIFNASLRSKNAELAAEARSILDAIAETREVLGERLAAARAEGRPDAEEWIELYLRSYPSRRARFARRVKRRETKAGNPAACGK